MTQSPLTADFHPQAVVKRFDAPERVLVFENGRLEVITVGGRPIAKGSYAPGWRWSRVAALHASARGGLPEHFGVVLTGRAKMVHRDGGETDLTPGDFFHAPSESDAWVVGYRLCEILYLGGVEALIKELTLSPDRRK